MPRCLRGRDLRGRAAFSKAHTDFSTVSPITPLATTESGWTPIPAKDWIIRVACLQALRLRYDDLPHIDCAIRLAERGIAPEAIQSIVCEVAEGTVHRLWEPLALKQAPPNAYAAKFKHAILHRRWLSSPGDAGLAAFSEATVREDPRIRALAAKVSFVIDADNPYPANYTGHIRAILYDGSVIEERQPHLRGGAHEKLSSAAIEAKFFANAAFGGWSKRSGRSGLRACPPDFRWAGRALRVWTTTDAPSCARSSAIARPIRRAAPVTSATLPASGFTMLSGI